MGSDAADIPPPSNVRLSPVSRRSVLKAGAAIGGGLAFGGAVRTGVASAAAT